MKTFKDLKEWWKNINTPLYKKSLDELLKNEKKDIRSTQLLYLMAFIIYAIGFCVYFAFLYFIDRILEVYDVGFTVTIMFSLVGIVIGIFFYLYLSNIVIYSAQNKEIMTVLKHLFIQVKMSNNPNQNYTNKIVCEHDFKDNLPETKCEKCGTTVLKAFDN